MQLRRVLALLMILLPARPRRLFAIHVLKWDIDPTAYVGRSVFLVRHLSMGPETSIGAMNVFRGLDELRLGTGAKIAQRNWVSAHPLAHTMHSPGARDASLVFGDWAIMTNGHVIDCSDRVEIKAHAAIAGYRTQILTHSLDLVRDRQVTGPVEVGEHSAVMSGCLLLSGTSVPAYSIVSAGSVVTTKLTAEHTFYRGNPAQPVRTLPDLRFFRRTPEDERLQT
jgi:acetyltransferase-like isoleucine patch superfamily enzyme